MCGPSLPLRLLLWIVGAAVSTTRGQVSAPASLTAEVGRPLLIGCNVTTDPGDKIHQVRWVNSLNKVILAYEQSAPPRFSHRDPNVQLTVSHNSASYITFKKVGSADAGCYQCIFDVFPKGQQKGSTCIDVVGKVHLDGNKTAISGKPTTLSCWYSLPERVQQVLWRKTAEQGDTTAVASFAKHNHYKIEHQFKGRVSLSRTLGDTELTIEAVRTEDEGCYTCDFHTYPDGTQTASACLSVYGRGLSEDDLCHGVLGPERLTGDVLSISIILPKPEVNQVTSPSGITEANCTAQSRPAAEIVWNVGSDNRTLGPPISSAYDQGDGTTIVTSTLLFHSGLFSDLSIKCIVHHQGLEKPLTLPLNKNMGSAMVVLLSVCGVAAVLLLCLCVCLCKCFICTDD